MKISSSSEERYLYLSTLQDFKSQEGKYQAPQENGKFSCVSGKSSSKVLSNFSQTERFQGALFINFGIFDKLDPVQRTFHSKSHLGTKGENGHSEKIYFLYFIILILGHTTIHMGHILWSDVHKLHHKSILLRDDHPFLQKSLYGVDQQKDILAPKKFQDGK